MYAVVCTSTTYTAQRTLCSKRTLQMHTGDGILLLIPAQLQPSLYRDRHPLRGFRTGGTFEGLAELGFRLFDAGSRCVICRLDPLSWCSGWIAGAYMG